VALLFVSLGVAIFVTPRLSGEPPNRAAVPRLTPRSALISRGATMIVLIADVLEVDPIAS
jgi:hypothetical protein